MTAARLSRAARIGMHAALIPIILTLCAFVAWTAGDYHWPYVVQSVDVEPEPTRPGGTVAVTTIRNFLDDCDLEFERQIESVEDPKHAAVILPDERMRTPWRLNGKPHTVRIAIPSDFPCGAAQIRTAPSASCNWMQVGWLRQRQRDVFTPFEVACGPPT